jgi:site-specific DNA-cytosine methylase
VLVEGVIPFDMAQITHPENRSKAEPGGVVPTMSKQSALHVAQVAPTIPSRTRAGGGLGTDMDCDGGLVTFVHPRVLRNSQSSNQVGIKPDASVSDCLTSEGPGAVVRHASDVSPAVTSKWAKGSGGPAGDEAQDLVAVAFKPSHYTRGKDGAPNEVTPPLTREADRGDQDPVVFTTKVRVSDEDGVQSHSLRDTLQQGGIRHGDAKETRPREVLRALYNEVGEEAFAEWGLGVLASFFPAEVLRSAVHGSGLRCTGIEQFRLVDYALSRTEDRPERALCQVRAFGSEGRPPCRWEPSEQRSIELGSYLSELSRPGTQGESVLLDLLAASEGSRVLRQALSAVQEVGRCQSGKGQSAHTNHYVRRLTVTECEFLQGFPRDYTLIPWRNKPATECPDGPRYKALGNSMAVPVMRWIGQRIADVEQKSSSK